MMLRNEIVFVDSIIISRKNLYQRAQGAELLSEMLATFDGRRWGALPV